MATFTVTTGNTFGTGSLAAAIAAAETTAGADTITFAGGLGILRPGSQFTLTTEIIFDGDADNDGIADVTISGDSDNNGFGNHSLFRIEPGANVTFDGLILRDGRALGLASSTVAGAIVNFGAVQIVNSQFIENEAQGADGSNGGPGANGSAGGDAAGAIYNGGTLSVTASVFMNNTGEAGNGGAGGNGADQIDKKSATDGGDGGVAGNAAGAIFNAAGAVMTLASTAFDSNIGEGGRGGKGGDGGDGATRGRDGGDGGDNGFAGGHVLNFGSVSGNASGVFGVPVSWNTSIGGAGGSGVNADGDPGSSGAAGIGSGKVVFSLGSAGNDARSGIAGDDEIHGLDGNDTLSAGTGDDLLFGGDGNDVLDGGIGLDRLAGQAGDDILKASTGDDLYQGAAGSDTIDFGAIATAVTIDLALTNAQAFFAGSAAISDVENIRGTAFGDTLSGNGGGNIVDGAGGGDSLAGGGGFDTLVGGDGADTLDGGANPALQGDILLGGPGDDVYHVDHGLDLVDEGIVFGGPADGVDEIISHADFFWDYYSAGDVIRVAEDAVDDGGDGTTIVGSVFSNFVVGNSKTNVLFGRGGSDTYIAGDGIDFISLSTLGLTDENAYAGVDGVNTVIVQQRASGPNSYDILFEFEVGKDKVDVSDYAAVNGLTSGAEVIARAVDDGTGSSYIALGDGLDYVYMVGLEKADLAAGDFIV